MGKVNYKKYKNQLREKFSYSCAYCEAQEPELGGASIGFSIDHYKPKKKFPDLIDQYENLVYSCLTCNRFKYQYWPNLVQEYRGHIVLHPFIHNIEQHIDKSTPAWCGLTNTGKWNVFRFRLDGSKIVELRKRRKNIQDIILYFENCIKRAETLFNDAMNKKNIGTANQIKEEINTFHERIMTLKKEIIGPMD